MDMVEITTELEQIDALRRAIKAEAMTYQAGAKRACAAFNGAHPTEYFDLPFDQWREVYDTARAAGWAGY